MCGICGVVQIGGTPRPVVGEETLIRMTDLMTHRGPNDRGLLYTPGAAIGARRLSIVDVAGGHQPVSNESQTIWAAQNGELYNHRDLRSDLARAGHVFRSSCDTEILPHLYERDGADFPRHLRGMFAVVLWDRPNRQTVLVRDRLGIKPLYYAHEGDLVVFASELKSVLASGLVPLDLDPQAIGAYLELGYVPGPLTPFKGVRKLMPGERVVVDPTGVRREAYWQYPEPGPNAESRGFDDEAELLLEHLDRSVELRLMSDVPLGAMLSGGLDSSLIVALMAKRMSEPVKTFSVGFAGEPNELDDARLVASAFGTEHHELELDPYAKVDLAELSWYLDEPLADLSALGFYALSALASDHVTVALSGQGADELFGGYRKHQAARIAGLTARAPSGVVRFAAAAGSRVGGSAARLASVVTADDAADRLLAMSSRLDAGTRARLTRGDLAGLEPPYSVEVVRRALRGIEAPPLATTLFLDGQLALVDDMLHYFDRMSMAHSLEVRVPFLDHRLVEYAATIPESHKVRRLKTKAILKRAAGGILPDRIINKPKIAFFRNSVGGWLDRQLTAAAAEYLLAPRLACEEFLQPDAVRELVAGNRRDGSSVDPQLVLAVVMLEVWLARTLPLLQAVARGADVPSSARFAAGTS